tara:strand:+ start:98 stop:346 length:249 start_codon:yes stop_codon:yes gene_type:complete
MENIEISKKSGYVILTMMTDWLEYADELDAKTRKEITVLDELIVALDAEQWVADLVNERNARMREQIIKAAADKAAKDKAAN